MGIKIISFLQPQIASQKFVMPRMIRPMYIGRSGELKEDGSLAVRKGGIKDELVNGKHDGKLRRILWLGEMLRENIEALDIYWYVTHNDKKTDGPDKIEKKLLSTYKNIYGESPRWNRT